LNSLRSRLTIALLSAILPLIVVVGIGLHVFVQSSLIARFDDGLVARARSITNATKFEHGRVELDIADEGSLGLFELRAQPITGTSELIGGSRSLGSEPVEPASAELPTARDVILTSGEAGRSLTVRFTPREDPEGEGDFGANQPIATTPAAPNLVLVVAAKRDELDATVRSLDLAILGCGALLVGGVVASVALALRRGLRPVASLAAEVEAIDASRLSSRVSEGALPLELQPIAMRTNALLDRINDAFERERRLTASAAHELRTPIAEIRAVTELALSRARSATEYQQALRSVFDVSTRMQSSVEGLLRLARIASWREPPNLEPVDIAIVVRDAWDRAMAPALARGVRATFEKRSTTEVQTDRALVTLIAGNLLANAAEYTPDGGDITSEVSRSGERIVWRLVNTASERVRTPDAGETVHLGIGLPLVAAAAAALGATFNQERQSARFTVTLEWTGVANA